MPVTLCLYVCSEDDCAQKPCKAQIAISGKVEHLACIFSPIIVMLHYTDIRIPLEWKDFEQQKNKSG